MRQKPTMCEIPVTRICARNGAYLLEHIYYAKENREGYMFTHEQILALFQLIHDRNYTAKAFESWDELFAANHPNIYKPEEFFMMNSKEETINVEDAHKILDRVDVVVSSIERDLRLTLIAVYIQAALIGILCAYIYFA
jgi:hypothetical protein